MKNEARAIEVDGAPARAVKCVVWDLDDTVWEGVLLEDDAVRLRPEASKAIEELDRRGILQSIASRNDPACAAAKLEEFGLHDYFVAPQIGWGAKSRSVERIAQELNIALDAFAFVDDQGFERDEVTCAHPSVLAIDAAQVATILSLPELTPRFVTEDSRRRRLLYQRDFDRKRAEEAFDGPQESFLGTLGMRFTIVPASEDHLQRAEELTERTHQLNSTGVPYGYDELDGFRTSSRHSLLVAELEDKYGSYGKIGLALVEKDETVWTLKVLLMSCRVMSRGVGVILLNHIMRCAKDTGVRLDADFVPTDRNRVMYVTFKFAGFREVEVDGEVRRLTNDLAKIAAYPHYVEVVAPESREI